MYQPPDFEVQDEENERFQYDGFEPDDSSEEDDDFDEDIPIQR